MNFVRICGQHDALKKHLKTESRSEDKSNEEREISSMISTLRQGGRVDIKTKFLNFTKISSESAGSNLQTVVSNKLNRRQPIQGQMKFRNFVLISTFPPCRRVEIMELTSLSLLLLLSLLLSVFRFFLKASCGPQILTKFISVIFTVLFLKFRYFKFCTIYIFSFIKHKHKAFYIQLF